MTFISDKTQNHFQIDCKKFPTTSYFYTFTWYIKCKQFTGKTMSLLTLKPVTWYLRKISKKVIIYLHSSKLPKRNNPFLSMKFKNIYKSPHEIRKSPLQVKSVIKFL